MWAFLFKENILYMNSCGEAKPKINGMSMSLVEQMTKPTGIFSRFFYLRK
jgi:hypothetical protein